MASMFKTKKDFRIAKYPHLEKKSKLLGKVFEIALEQQKLGTGVSGGKAILDEIDLLCDHPAGIFALARQPDVFTSPVRITICPLDIFIGAQVIHNPASSRLRQPQSPRKLLAGDLFMIVQT
jgi:hypothetical protein